MPARTHPSPGAVQPGGAAGAAVVRRGRGVAAGLMACALGVASTLAFAAPQRPVALMIGALVALAAVIVALMATGLWHRGPVAVRGTALVVVAATTGVAGHYFGVHGTLAAVLAPLLVILGLAVEPPVQPRWMGVGVHVSIAGSQLVVFTLVVVGALPDVALVPVHLDGHPVWHAVVAHVGLQGIYAGAFVAGGAAARRYHRLVDDIEAASRAADRHDALLAEARADYARAIELARHGAVAPPGPRALGRGAPTDEPSSATLEQATGGLTVEDPMVVTSADPTDADPVAAASRAVARRDESRVDSSSSGAPVSSGIFGPVAPDTAAWQAAYHARMRQQDAVGLALCVVGGVLLATITIDPLPRVVALVSIGGIATAFLLRQWHRRRAPDSTSYGAWIVVAVLGAGPLYAWGVHSAITSVTTSLLFAGGLFRPPRRGLGVRVLALAGAMAAQLALFVLVLADVLPDQSNVPVLLPGQSTRDAVLQHGVLQLACVGAFVAGTVVDRRFADAFRQAEAAHHDALRRAAQVRETRAEIDEALRRIGGGLFTGTTVSGYAVGRLLGRGGMGEVYEAVDPDGGRVALKLIRADRAGDPASLARFTAEADVLTRIESPYVARVFAIGGGGPGELPSIAMEYVEGRSLAELLRERERLSSAGVASLVRDIARGLHEVHAAGFIHLDVKPSNIVLTERVELASRWCLIDFGVARLAARAAPDAIAGTPLYMAPEHALGGKVDARADLYGLCLVIYRALTGRPAFTGADRVALAEAARRGPPDPRAHAAMHDDVVAFLRIGLAFDPAARWGSALELRTAFERAVAGKLSDAHRARAAALGA